MKNNNVYERAIALLEEMLDLMAQIENAPDRLFPQYLPGKERRLLKRRAERLRSGKARPRHENLFSGPDLAQLYEDTVAANELREKTGPAFEKNFNAMGALTREDGPAVKQALDDFFLDALARKREEGPGSEGERRWNHLQFFVGFINSCRTDNRREKPGQMPQPKQKAIVPLVPAELLSSAPRDEPVILIPAEDSGRERMFIRIGDIGKVVGRQLRMWIEERQHVLHDARPQESLHFRRWGGVHRRREITNARGAHRDRGRRNDEGQTADGFHRDS